LGIEEFGFDDFSYSHQMKLFVILNEIGKAKKEEKPAAEVKPAPKTIPKIGINGFGRIGRLVMRAAIKNGTINKIKYY